MPELSYKLERKNHSNTWWNTLPGRELVSVCLSVCLLAAQKRHSVALQMARTGRDRPKA